MRAEHCLCARTVWEKLRDRVRENLGEEFATAVIHLSSAMWLNIASTFSAQRILHRPIACRDRLSRGQPCWLISTQVIEAGVDVDFPGVFRALARSRAIVQVAGRCNREGLLKDEATGEARHGDVFVFDPAEKGLPPGFYQRPLATHALYCPARSRMTSSPLIRLCSPTTSTPCMSAVRLTPNGKERSRFRSCGGIQLPGRG